MNIDDSVSNLKKIILYVGTCLSVVSCLYLFILLKNNQSNYARILKYISICEAVFIYSLCLIILENEFREIEYFFSNLLDKVLFNLYIFD